MRHLIISAAMFTGAAVAFAQAPVDAMALSKTELRGSARFVSMGGAFTALGADISSLGQNPAGIGVYRGSDISITMGGDFNSVNSESSEGANKETASTFNVNSAGYVGTYLFGDNRDYSFSWGFTYNRLMRFNRTFSGPLSPMNTSISNYIASITNGVDPSELWMSNSSGALYPYDNYSANAPDWMSVLFYNSGMINPVTYNTVLGDVVETDEYAGLFQHGDEYPGVPESQGYADYAIRERGHADEYNITFGGAVMNTVYWGIGVGITDLSFEREYSFHEEIDNALVPADPAGYRLGNAAYSDVYAWQKISGTGANFKIGVIIKPINEFRIGIAMHTPTYYSLSSSSFADTDFSFNVPSDSRYKFQGQEYTPYDDYNFKLHTPWKMMVGVAGVVGGRFILSADYEYDAYKDMKLKGEFGDDMSRTNDLINKYYKSTNTIRVGAEVRVTPQFSLRAGCNFSSTPSGNILTTSVDESLNGTASLDLPADAQEISTAGQNLSYEVNDKTSYFTLGAGYRVGGLYIDVAYLHKHHSSTFSAFTPFVDYDGYWSTAPTAKLTDNASQIMATIGYRF